MGNFHRLSGYCAEGDAGRMTIQDKYNKLLEHISAYERVAIAFSGGVDSTFLCRAAMEASCLRPIAISLVSPFIPHREVEEAKDLAKKSVSNMSASKPSCFPKRSLPIRKIAVTTVKGSSLPRFSKQRPATASARSWMVQMPTTATIIVRVCELWRNLESTARFWR